MESKECKIGQRFHGIRVEVTEDIHDSGYNMLKVYGYGFERYDNPDNEIYLGEFDVIGFEQSENRPSFSIDSTKPNSEFEVRIMNKMFELTWAMESIRFKILTWEEERERQIKESE